MAGLLTRPYSPQATVEKVSVNLERLLKDIDTHASSYRSQLQQNANLELESYRGVSFFLFEGGQLQSWSDNKFVPTSASVEDTFKLKVLKAGNGDYLAKKWKLNSSQELVAIIPLFRKFNITNDYLQTWWNKNIFLSPNISILEPGASLGLPVCAQEECAFRISFLPDTLPVNPLARSVAIVFLVITLVLLTVLVYKQVRELPYPELGLLILYAFFFAVRSLMVRLNFPHLLFPNWLFNPQVFASSTLNASLGDLILNELAVLVMCFYLFKNYQRFKIFQYLFLNNWVSWLISILAGLGILFSFLFPFVAIQTIYNNSTIVLDISQSLDFNRVRVFGIAVVLLAGICSFLFAHTTIRLLIADGNRIRIFVSLVIAIVLFSMINSLTEQPFVSSLLVGTFYFLLIYFLKLYSGLKRLTFATFSYLFIAVSFLSANGAYAIWFFSRQEQVDNQFKFADNFLIDRDIFGEYLLRETATKISKDVFIQTRINVPFLSRDAIRQKVRQVFLPSYFNKYDVTISLFGSSGEPLNNRTDATLSEFIGIYDQDAYHTPYESVYFIPSPARDVAQKYLVKIPIQRGGFAAAYVMLELSLKRIIPENVYPELLVDNSLQQTYKTEDISYAVYADTIVVFSSGKFNYDMAFNKEWLGNPELYRLGIVRSGFLHIAQEDENNRVAVVSSLEPSPMYALSNFSFLLVLGLAIILLFILIQGVINYFQGEKLYFSARIQLLLNLAFFLPLILVSITTLNLSSRSSQSHLTEEYLDKAENFSSQLSAQLDDYLNGYNETATSFENSLTDLAKLSNMDANVYTAKGELLATSQPQIFENELVSNYINSRALRKIARGESVIVETERVGSLEFYVSYAALKAPLTGKLEGILGIPFFQSGHSTEKAQIDIVSNILNIFALIFIALVILSYFVSVWLTFPLRFITQSLQRTSLTKVNQPLKWKADDEIGLMVKEYNQMLFKLSESKAELEQNQRERTWREIAQQVAHEIKNPLTPMKLTLQQLQRSVQSESNSQEKTEKAVATLLTQIETLSEIASSFSTFAKMPEPVMQRLELVSLVKRIVLLHSQSGELSFQSLMREAFVQGDEQLLGRTFSNIILNAFQSARPGQPQQLKITLTSRLNKYVLQFDDNGKGIEPQIAERIFLSHFSTKKSGSGLGLAIAKQAIEHMNGRIWFETVVGKGTTFFIELPAR